MVTIRVNGKTYKCPTSWFDTTTGQYQRIKSVKEPDILKLFCVLIGCDFDEIASSRLPSVERAMWDVAKYVLTEPEYFRSMPIPDSIRIDGVRYKIPKKIDNLTIQQNMIIRQALAQPDVSLEQLISLAMATFIQPIIDGKFDVEKSRELEKRIQEMPIDETFPIGFFLLNRALTFGRVGLRYWIARLNPMNWKKKLIRSLALRNLIRLPISR